MGAFLKIKVYLERFIDNVLFLGIYYLFCEKKDWHHLFCSYIESCKGIKCTKYMYKNNIMLLFIFIDKNIKSVTR